MLALLTAVLLSGCQLAKPELNGDQTPDRLIGILITTEHLDLLDTERFLEDNFTSFSGGRMELDGNQKAYQGRLYAELTEIPDQGEELIFEYTFPDTEGLPFLIYEITNENGDSSVTSTTQDEISNAHFGVFSDENEERHTLEGTLYLASGAGDTVHYLNHVYQTASGEVYAMTGNGIAMTGDRGPGVSHSLKLEETTTITENGKNTKQTTVIDLTISLRLAPQKLRLLEMKNDNTILSSNEFAPDKLPKEIVPQPETAYLLLESYQMKTDGTEEVVRTIFSPDTSFLESYYEAENGIICQNNTPILWK